MTTPAATPPQNLTALALAAKEAIEGQWIEIFLAGLRTSEEGDVFTFAVADVKDIATGYDPALHEAPLVIGHPDSDLPAHGWVLSLRATDDGRLLARVHQVDATFAARVLAGAIKKRSAAFYHPQDPKNPRPGHWYLRHVGFLGAQPPAVKGLADIKPLPTSRFAEAPARRVSFAEAATTTPIQPARSTSMTPEEIAKLEADKKAAQAALAEANAATAKAQEEANRLRDEQAARDKTEAEKRHAANVAFAESACGKGQPVARVLPADKDKLIATLDTLGAAHVARPVTFAEGDKKVAFDPVAYVQGLVQRLPAAVAFSEHQPHGTPVGTFSSGGTPGASELAQMAPADLDARIKAHMAQHKVTYAEAAQAVCPPVSFTA